MHKLYHRIDNIAGNVIQLHAEGVRYRELAEVTSRLGTSLAQVIRLSGDAVSLQVFAGGRGVGRPPNCSGQKGIKLADEAILIIPTQPDSLPSYLQEIPNRQPLTKIGISLYRTDSSTCKLDGSLFVIS